MRSILLCVVLLLAPPFAIGSEDFVLIDGREFKNATVISQTETTITIRCDGGAVIFSKELIRPKHETATALVTAAEKVTPVLLPIPVSVPVQTPPPVALEAQREPVADPDSSLPISVYILLFTAAIVGVLWAVRVLQRRNEQGRTRAEERSKRTEAMAEQPKLGEETSECLRFIQIGILLLIGSFVWSLFREPDLPPSTEWQRRADGAFMDARRAANNGHRALSPSELSNQGYDPQQIQIYQRTYRQIAEEQEAQKRAGR